MEVSLRRQGAYRAHTCCMASKPQWCQFGWQGIRVETPRDWSLSRVQGDRDKGYLRLDDEYAVRAELRWERPRKGGEPFDRIVERFVAQMRKLAGRKMRLEVTRHLKLDGPAEHEWEALRCSGDAKALWLLARCPTCGRVTGLSLLPRPGRGVERELADRVFRSLQDHSGDGLDLWDVYDVRFRLPQELRLRKTSLRTGSIELSFSDGRREYYVRRLSLAQLVLRDTALADWLQGAEASALKGFGYEVYSATMHGHDAIRLLGQMTLGRRLLSRRVRRRYYHAYAWHCPRLDRIYIMRAITLDEDDEAFEAHARTLECH
jgi:hypothetical protein